MDWNGVAWKPVRCGGCGQTDMGNAVDNCGASLESEENIMQTVKRSMETLVKKTIRVVAMTTISSTTRYLAYQPKKDEELAEKYLAGK